MTSLRQKNKNKPKNNLSENLSTGSESRQQSGGMKSRLEGAAQTPETPAMQEGCVPQFPAFEEFLSSTREQELSVQHTPAAWIPQDSASGELQQWVGPGWARRVAS